MQNYWLLLLTSILLLFPATLYALHIVIYSMLVGSMKGKLGKSINSAFRIAQSYSWIERLKQNYIEAYLTDFKKPYKTYMCIKRIYIIWFVSSSALLIIVSYWLTLSTLWLLCKTVFFANLVFAVAFGSRVGIDKRTKYDRNK